MDNTMVFEFLGLDDLLSRPSKKWLFQNLIGMNDLVMIYGTPWSGKTLVAIDLIMSYVTQSPFSSFPFCHEDGPRTILYCTDEGVDGLSARFNAALHKYGDIPTERIKISLDLPNLFLPKHKHNITIFIKELKDLCPGPFSPRMIIIDTLKNATIGSSENSNDDAAIIASAAKQIKRAFDCTVLFIHHSDKNGHWPRGASAFLGDMDCIIKIEDSKMIVEKVKDGKKAEPQAFSIVEANGSESVVIEWQGAWVDISNKCLSYLKDNTPQKFTARQVSEAMGILQSSVIKNLQKLALDNGVVYTCLTEPNKEPSRYNPSLYWYSDDIFGVSDF